MDRFIPNVFKINFINYDFLNDFKITRTKFSYCVSKSSTDYQKNISLILADPSPQVSISRKNVGIG